MIGREESIIDASLVSECMMEEEEEEEEEKEEEEKEEEEEEKEEEEKEEEEEEGKEERERKGGKEKGECMHRRMVWHLVHNADRNERVCICLARGRPDKESTRYTLLYWCVRE